jgi:hypothetical protein
MNPERRIRAIMMAFHLRSPGVPAIVTLPTPSGAKQSQ